MKLKFSISYRTAWGETLCVALTTTSSDGLLRHYHYRMQTDDGDNWSLETPILESRHHPLAGIVYHYQVEDSDGQLVRSEWTLVPRRYSFDPTKDYLFHDQWRDRPLPCHLYTDACRATLRLPLGERVRYQQFPLYRRTLLFRVSAPQLRAGQAVALCGSHPSIGSWNPSRYLLMEPIGQSEWMLSVNAMGMTMPLEYKYVVVDETTHQLLCWEEGENRTTTEEDPTDGQVNVLYGEQLRIREEMWRAAGVAVPVSALRSSHSYGVGDFGDLRRFVAWAAQTGMSIIQLLPVLDTTTDHRWGDACPYQVSSAFALHPHYVDLEAAGMLTSKSQMTQFERQRQELNALPECDYEAVDRVKTAYLTALFAEKGSAVLATEECRAFVASNEDWLRPYAEFRSESYDFVCYVQYLLHSQLKAAADAARDEGIILKGDLPVGMRREGVEVRQHPEFFRMDGQTGTPPDRETPFGQNWCFPAYRWTEGERRPLETWMQRRLKHMEPYFGAVRIDHILGYFRTWEIPVHAVDGTLGHFVPALPFSVDEIEYFGLHFRKELFTQPFINERVISRIFGIHAAYVKQHFLQAKAYQLYDLKSAYDTQRKVAKAFEGLRDENSIWIRDGLMRLVADVLFVEDTEQPGMYHPRIQAMDEPVFEALPADDKEAYLRLYSNYFGQRHDTFWANHARRRLEGILKECRMLVCGEDLGSLPDCVDPVLDNLRILSLEMQRLPKHYGVEFTHLESNPYRSVCTTSTHDQAPLRLWWQENPVQRQRYFVTMLQREGRAPEQLPAHLAEDIIARHLYCPSMICILPLQDWLAMDGELRRKRPQDERINLPSDSGNRWNYRMHLTIEQLMSAARFNEKLHTMMVRSRRLPMKD